MKKNNPKTVDDKWKDQVRKRESYKRFEKLYDTMSSATIEDKLWTIYNLLESYKAFGSQSGSDYCKQSITLLINDKKQL